MPDLSIIIVNWNTRQLLLDCIASIYTTVRRSSFEIFVVDNGSADDSVASVRVAFPEVKLIANKKNYGFAKANNMAMKEMTGKYAVLLNSDTVLKENALDSLFEFMERHPYAGMCGPQLLNKNDSKQKSFDVFPKIAEEFTSKNIVKLINPGRFRNRKVELKGPSTVDFVMGACMFVRKSAIEKVGMLDEDYFFFYEEIDWCYRMRRADWAVYFLPDVEVYHFGGQSTKTISLRARAESWRSRYLFFQKNSDVSGLKLWLMYIAGLILVVRRFLGYSLLNAFVLFIPPRLRQRWVLFGYLLIWHLAGFPVKMGLPRNG